MSETLPAPSPERFPSLEQEPTWVRELPTGTGLSRIFKAGGMYPVAWHEFREFGPVDARFDPHPLPPDEYPGEGVLYAAIETGGAGAAGERDDVSPRSDPTYSAIAACMIEAFQHTGMVQRSEGAPTLVMCETQRPLRLLDLSDSDWITVAGGNAAISSGDRSQARAWARCIRAAYPDIDGVVSASSVIPSARIAALWNPARNALPRHPLAQLRLDQAELTSLIDAIADRYGFLVL